MILFYSSESMIKQKVLRAGLLGGIKKFIEKIYFKVLFSGVRRENIGLKWVKLNKFYTLTLPWRRSLSYRNQRKSTDWFLYDGDFRHERLNLRTLFLNVNSFYKEKCALLLSFYRSLTIAHMSWFLYFLV